VEALADLLPGFEVLEFLGRGGMGAVYKARQRSLDRVVAIKLLPMEVAEEANFAQRFAREARTLARLNHPRIVAAYDYGTTAERHSYFVMEYVEGVPLHVLIDARTLQPPKALQIMTDVCEGLGYAHEHGVVHRDIKPANVLIDRQGRAKIADFGIAHLNLPDGSGLTTGGLLGTQEYMAPEQLEHRSVDARADIYAFGVMLYEVLCHQVPRGQMEPPSVRVGVDHRVDEIVAKAMQNAPERRYQSTEEILAELKLVLTTAQPAQPKAKAAALLLPPVARPRKEMPAPIKKAVSLCRYLYLPCVPTTIAIWLVILASLGWYFLKVRGH
jgi:serine/threonine protein kinase